MRKKNKIAPFQNPNFGIGQNSMSQKDCPIYWRDTRSKLKILMKYQKVGESCCIADKG